VFEVHAVAVAVDSDDGDAEDDCSQQLQQPHRAAAQTRTNDLRALLGLRDGEDRKKSYRRPL
jgi:hypothetical protein